MVSEGIRYTREHEWVLPTGEGTVRIGITDYAQQQLGDVVYVQLPDAGESVEGGAVMGEVESTKSVSDLYAPLPGEIVNRNDQLDEQPELINSDPFDQGWMVELRPRDPDALEGFLDEAAYRELTEQE